MSISWIYLGLAIAAEVIGTTALKASDGFTRLVPTLVVTAGYGTAFYMLSLALREIPMGVSYAIWSGIGIVAITIIGAVRFGEIPNTPTLIGMGLIVLGVVVVNLATTVPPTVPPAGN